MPLVPPHHDRARIARHFRQFESLLPGDVIVALHKQLCFATGAGRAGRAGGRVVHALARERVRRVHFPGFAAGAKLYPRHPIGNGDRAARLQVQDRRAVVPFVVVAREP
jgi:hypothetical protein